MRVKAMFVLTAMLDENTHIMFQYDYDEVWTENGNYLETVLDKFWHEDYPELMDWCDGERTGESFPIRVQSSPDRDGWMEHDYMINFIPVVWHHYFDKGWSASSEEPNQRYTWEQFISDIRVKGEPKKVYVVTFINDTSWELPNVSVNVRDTMEAARQCLDEEWQTLLDENKDKDWDKECSKKNDSDFLFIDNHDDRVIGEIHEKEIN